MTEDDIIRMAAAAGIPGWDSDEPLTVDHLKLFATLVAAAERELCLDACQASYIKGNGPEGWLTHAVQAISAIGTKDDSN